LFDLFIDWKADLTWMGTNMNTKHSWNQSYDRGLQRQRCKNLQRHE
jgi:hypothetical protein